MGGRKRGSGTVFHNGGSRAGRQQGASECTCNKGYTGPDGVECTVCDAGGFKDTNG